MAARKKGQLAQFMVPLVDSTDFASIESAITASDFNSGATVKFYGLNHGGSAATTSGTVSKTASLVHSGVFRITLKTTENNYDEMMLRVNKTGCAEQIIAWANVDNDDSDLMSNLLLTQSMASDAASAAAQANSRVLLVQSRLSDLDSRLASDLSDALSGITALSGLVSDAHSAATLGASRALVIQSRLSDFDSRLVSDVSDIRSMLTAMSDAISDAHSDLASKIGGITVTISASDVSDIASAVVAGLPIASLVSDIYSLLSDLNSNFNSRVPLEPAGRSQLSDLSSDVKSAVSVGSSRVLLVQSRLSDLDSRLVSELSDVLSQLTVVQSMASDAASAAQQGNSRVLLNQSRISDVYSLLSDLQSDFQSRVPKAVATNSQLSDLHSDLKSHAAVMSGIQSDIYSLLQAGPEIGASSMSDLRSAIAATELDASDLSDIASAVRANLASDLSDIVSGITALQSDNPNTPTKAVQLSNFMFMMVDATDLNTPETGITVTATISKDGGAFAACTNSVSEVSGGWYKITLTSTEMNADAVALKFTGTGCAQRNIYMRTQPT